MKSYPVSARIYGSRQHKTHFLNIMLFASSGISRDVKERVIF
jgi:hypothetical protein